MENWKRIVLKAAGFGGGFALVAAVILGGVVWWSSRPAKPKPWNKTAITATFANMTTEGPTHTVVFNYTLENHTDADYTVSHDSQAHLGFERVQTKAMDFSDKTFLKADFPIYIPANSRVSIALHVPLPYPADDWNYDAPEDLRYDYHTKLSRFVSDTITNVEGFVLMDDTARYEIVFPNGWTAIGNRPLKVKASDTAK